MGIYQQLRAHSESYRSLHCTPPHKTEIPSVASIAAAIKLNNEFGGKKIKPEAKRVSDRVNWDFDLITLKISLFLF